MLKTLIAAVIIALAYAGAANADESSVQAPETSVVDTTIASVKPVMGEAVTAVRAKTCEAGKGLHNTANVAELKSESFLMLAKIAPADIEQTLKKNAFSENAKAFFFGNAAKVLKLACGE